ncbi:hypothetical protein AX16_005756 [Volvariella volvacea WC 439]|nr:hypothetical protein AX16_005756 [Volvariella volvacea WC 439]
MANLPDRITITHPSLHANDLNRLVKGVSIAGTATIDGNPPDSVYHFRFLLVFEDGGSVCLDIQPYLLDNHPLRERGLLMIESRPHPVVLPHTISWSHALAIPTPAGQILNYILNEKKRDQYDFDQNGEGCRFWCEHIVQDLLDARVLGGDAWDSWKHWEREETKRQAGRMPDPRPQGKFYE